MTDMFDIIDAVKDICQDRIFYSKNDAIVDISDRTNSADVYSKIIYRYLCVLDIRKVVYDETGYGNRINKTLCLTVSWTHIPGMKIGMDYFIDGEQRTLKIRHIPRNIFISHNKVVNSHIYTVNDGSKNNINVNNPNYKKYDRVMNLMDNF